MADKNLFNPFPNLFYPKKTPTKKNLLSLTTTLVVTFILLVLGQSSNEAWKF